MTTFEEKLNVHTDETDPTIQGQSREDQKLKIPVVPGEPLHDGVSVVVGALPVRLIAQNHTIPYRDALRKVGYQRKPQISRINKLKSELNKGRVDIPTAVLLNLRGDEGKYCLKDDETGHHYIEIDPESGPKFYVVDGQHRIIALVELCLDDPDKWGDVQLQFVLLIGASEKQEMRQFYVVNSTAKSVKTDLALDLLKQQYDADGRVMQQTIESGQEWKVKGQGLVDELNNSSPVWKSKIQLANEPKGETVIPAASFVASLKPLLQSRLFGSLKGDQQVRIINAFWMGVREACREPFDGRFSASGEEEYSTGDYTLLKGIGVSAMHDLLVTVLEIVRSRGDSVMDYQSYVEIMEDVLQNLEGDSADGLVSGPSFWLTAPNGGAAGSFSSSAGKRVLQAKLRQHLPEIELE